MNYVLSIIGALIALVEVGFIIYKYSKETLRRRRNETIIIYGSIFIKTYHLRDKLIELTGNPTFSSKAISENNELYKATMDYLTIVEGFAKGLDYGVYDF